MRKAVSIIAFHGLHEKSAGDKETSPRSSMERDEFAFTVKMIRSVCDIVSLDDAVDMIRRKKDLRKRSVVLTFDDSLKCQLSITAPILAGFKIPATFYISTAVVDAGKPYWWRRLEYCWNTTAVRNAELTLLEGKTYAFREERKRELLATIKTDLKQLPPDLRETCVEKIEAQLGTSVLASGEPDPYGAVLSWDGVRALAGMGMTIGSHTITHCNVAIAPPRELLSEVRESRNIIERECRLPCDHFAYPYGLFSKEAAIAVRDSGYRSAVTTETPGWNVPGCNEFELRRFSAVGNYKQLYMLSGLHRLVHPGGRG
jgi:peptidoglycan/xylan/chitin deacetylase (PgdA/CDA1 family)